jgi:hypothetical protein
MEEKITQGSLFGVPSPAEKWDQDVARRALDELFYHAHQYNSSVAYKELMDFVVRFRFYAPFNALLIHTQMPGAKYVAPAYRWFRDFGRHIRVGARPLVILQPMGPVMFVFDVSDTEPEANAPPLPPEVEHPFEVRSGKIGNEYAQTRENAKRDGISITEQDAGSQSAGAIQSAQKGQFIDVLAKLHPETVYVQVPRRYDLTLNLKHSAEAKYATLVHELAHLYCGHLGTPNDKWWPDRRGLHLDEREFEAESVCYLVCKRIGIDNPSDEYLSGYLCNSEFVPQISIECVMKASGLIEQMGRERLKLRKEKDQ